MSTQTEIKISGSALAVLPLLKNKIGALNAVAKAMDEVNQFTLNEIVEKRMLGIKGPFPVEEHRLGKITGFLRHSIRASKSTVSGDGVSSSIGSSLVYAAIQEFGGTIHRPAIAGGVRLRTNARGELMRQPGGWGAVFAAKNHIRSRAVKYQGKAYDIDIPERAPVRTAIADQESKYNDAVTSAIVNYWKGESD